MIYPVFNRELIQAVAGLHYVYGVFINRNEVKPLYIGKGVGRRVMAHLYRRKDSNIRLRRWLAAHDEGQAVVRLMFISYDEDCCYAREAELVNKFGRIEDGGCLFNFTPGGRGGCRGINRGPSTRKGKTFRQIYGDKSDLVRAIYARGRLKTIPPEKIKEAKKVLELLCQGLTPKEVSNYLNLSYKFVAGIRNGDSFAWLATDEQKKALAAFHGLYTKVPLQTILRVAKRIKKGDRPEIVAAEERLGLNTVKRIGHPLRGREVGYYRVLFNYNKEYHLAVGGPS